MERTDFTREDHRQAFDAYQGSAHGARTAKAHFWRHGVTVTLYDEETGSPEAQTPWLTSAEARVIAMEMLDAADRYEALPPREDPASE